jgi:hypothetical protein
MKRVCTILLVVVCIIINAFSQVPEKMSYQAVVRNSSDELVKNSMVGMKISILQGSITGTPIYVETQAVSTNANGLLTVEIGDGIPITGTFSDIDWSKGPYYLKTETDPTGGTTYTISGVSQLISVPYALHAKTADNITGTIYETDPVFGTSPAAAITVTDTANWNNKLDTEADGSVTNEIQTLGLNGDQLSISGTGGNTITFTNWDTNWSNDVLVIGDQTIAGNKTFTGTINANSNTVINVADPVNNKDAANKAYVDQLIARIEALEETIFHFFRCP